jgi:hypothetical protein
MIGLLPIRAMRETGGTDAEIAQTLRFMADFLERK